MNINRYPLNKIVINKWEVYEENFDEVYKLEFRETNKNDNNNNNKDNANIIQKPKTNILSTNLVLDNMKNIDIQSRVIYYTKHNNDDFYFNENNQINNLEI